MKELTKEIKNEIDTLVYDFFEDNCEVEKDSLKLDTSIIDDLDGDSLMFLELVELVCKKYEIKIKMQVVGKYILKHNATTIGEVLDVCYGLYQKGNDLLEEETV